MTDKKTYEDSKRALLDRPYAERQMIVMIDDELIESGKYQSRSPTSVGEGKSKQLAVYTSIGLALMPFPLNVLAPAVVTLVQSLGKLREEGVEVLSVVRSEFAKLVVPPGHPRDGILYIGHPALPEVYYPAAQFHRLTFEHKFSEAIRFLMALGAIKIEVEHIAGWSSEFSAKLGVGLPAAKVEVGAEAGRVASTKAEILFKANLAGTTEPKLPENLVWYPHEPTWRQIAEGRLQYGLKDFVLSVRYEDDFGVNAGLKVQAVKAGLDMGGKFEDHEATIWRLQGEFA